MGRGGENDCAAEATPQHRRVTAGQAGPTAKTGDKTSRKAGGGYRDTSARTAIPSKSATAARSARPSRRSRITRGTVSIDARIDLHGMTQASAHRKLRNFIEDCQENGKKIVLVITGKGRPDATHGIDAERGILRRQVPIWLGSAELRSYVIGYEPAGRSHGGEGALYVRIRSRRKSDS